MRQTDKKEKLTRKERRRRWKEAKAENTSEPTELKLRDFMVCIDLKALNSDPDLSVPEDVKAAAVEGNTDNAMDMLSDLSDMFS